ncbi:MAG: beta-propeller domain-containing protein [Nitrososphaerales archaeon]
MEGLKGSSPRRGAAIFTITMIGVMAVMGALALSSSSHEANASNTNAVEEGFGSFQSYSQLQEFMTANAESAQEYNTYGSWLGGTPVLFGGVARMNADFTLATAAPSVDTFASTSATTFTSTNVQVQGVDEPDWVKTDGTNLFVSANDTVTIMNAYPPSSASVLSTVKLPGTQVIGLEIAQDRLMVIDQRYSNTTYIDLLLYNTSDLSSPRLVANTSVAGTYVAARLAQGYFYAVLQQPSYSFDSNGNATGVMPTLSENGVETTLPPSSVYYTPDRSQISYYTMVVSVDMSSGNEKVASVLTGPSSTIYVSTSNIYVVYTNYQQWYADNIPGDVFTGGVISSASLQQPQNSTIFRASYSYGNVTVEAVGSVPGTVLNQFSLDEYGDYFRVATSRFADIAGATTVSDDVYVLSMNMSQVAALRNIAPGENIYAVSFVGDVGYVVTYEQVDPLFVISFENITSPVILSALKVTGYSDYLYPLPGGYLIGVGKDAVASSTGNFSYYLGLKLSLFQVFANGTSTQVAKVLIGDRGTDSPVLTDHLAFTYDPSANITVIPVLLAKVSGNQSYGTDSPPPYGDPVWQGVYVFRVTAQGFTLLGTVSQYPAGQNYGDSPNSGLQIERSVIIGNDLYTVSQGEVMISDLGSFATLGTIQLPS